jgi:hypothetical protein
VQRGAAFGGVGHTCPHAPQFDGSVANVTHAPAQYDVGGAQTELHTPAEHTVPGAHARPHAPQSMFVVVGVSQPLASVPSQLPQPAMQPAMPHAPPTHEDTAFAALHTLPHAPHAVGVVFRLVSHPFDARPSQSP